jgi:hypothetical protein
MQGDTVGLTLPQNYIHCISKFSQRTITLVKSMLCVAKMIFVTRWKRTFWSLKIFIVLMEWTMEIKYVHGWSWLWTAERKLVKLLAQYRIFNNSKLANIWLEGKILLPFMIVHFCSRFLRKQFLLPCINYTAICRALYNIQSSGHFANFCVSFHLAGFSS